MYEYRIVKREMPLGEKDKEKEVFYLEANGGDLPTIDRLPKKELEKMIENRTVSNGHVTRKRRIIKIVDDAFAPYKEKYEMYTLFNSILSSGIYAIPVKDANKNLGYKVVNSSGESITKKMYECILYCFKENYTFEKLNSMFNVIEDTLFCYSIPTEYWLSFVLILIIKDMNSLLSASFDGLYRVSFFQDLKLIDSNIVTYIPFKDIREKEFHKKIRITKDEFVLLLKMMMLEVTPNDLKLALLSLEKTFVSLTSNSSADYDLVLYDLAISEYIREVFNENRINELVDFYKLLLSASDIVQVEIVVDKEDRIKELGTRCSSNALFAFVYLLNGLSFLVENRVKLENCDDITIEDYIIGRVINEEYTEFKEMYFDDNESDKEKWVTAYEEWQEEISYYKNKENEIKQDKELLKKYNNLKTDFELFMKEYREFLIDYENCKLACKNDDIAVSEILRYSNLMMSIYDILYSDEIINIEETSDICLGIRRKIDYRIKKWFEKGQDNLIKLLENLSESNNMFILQMEIISNFKKYLNNATYMTEDISILKMIEYLNEE